MIFVHVHKTAGTTLRSLIDRQYRPEEIASVDWKQVEEFKRWSPERRAAVRMLRGHMAFGLHEYLPRPATYITLLRDPVERVVSHYWWMRGRTDHELGSAARQADLVGYLEGGAAADLDNGQVRQISGEPHVPVGQMTESHLERAIANIDDHFAVAGLSERFDEALIVLRSALGWRAPLYYRRQNVTRSRPVRVDDRTADAVRTHNRLDLALYEHAARRFDERVRALGSSLARELTAFRRRNRALNAFYPVIGPARRAARALGGPAARRR